MRHLLPLTRTGLVSLFLVGLLFGYCDQSDATSPDALSGDNAVKDAAAANVDTLPTRDFSYLEETLDPKITGTAKLIGPAATDGTKLDPVALSKLCSKNAHEEKKCLEALKNFDVHAGYIEYERPYAARTNADPKLFPGEKSKERGFQWYIL